MVKRAIAAAGAVLFLTGCSSTAEALEIATKSCSLALEVVEPGSEQRNRAADLAADAADLDSKWDRLVEATTTWAEVSKEVDDAISTNYIAPGLSDRAHESRILIETECRKVRAAK